MHRCVLAIPPVLHLHFYIIAASLSLVTTNVSYGSSPWQPQMGDVQLKAMPDFSFRNPTPRETSKQQRRYRTPFIIPMTPPGFTELPLLAARATEAVSWGRPSRLPSIHFEASESVAIGLNRRGSTEREKELLSRHFLMPRRESHTAWASNVVPATMFESKVVSVAKPNVSRLGAKIQAHNLNVQVIEGQLRKQINWTLDDLEAALQQLVAQHKTATLLTLYWRLLEPQEKWQLGNVASGEANRERFRQRLFETRVAWDIHPKAITLLDKEEVSTRFKELEQQIEQLEASVEASVDEGGVDEGGVDEGGQ